MECCWRSNFCSHTTTTSVSLIIVLKSITSKRVIFVSYFTLPFFDKALSNIHSVSTDLSTHNLLCLIPPFYTLFPLLDIVPNRLSNPERKCISQTMSFITSYATAKMCAKNWNRQTIMYELLMVNYCTSTWILIHLIPL